MKNKYKGFTAVELIAAVLIFATMAFAARIETFKQYLVNDQQLVTTGGVQYSDSIQVTDADTAYASDTTYVYYQIDAGFAQTFRYNTLTSLYLNFEVRIRNTYFDSIGGGDVPITQWKIQGKDTNSTWTDLSGLQSHSYPVGTSNESTFVSDTLFGFADLDSVRKMPAQLRIFFRSDSGALLQVHDNSYIEPTFQNLY